MTQLAVPRPFGKRHLDDDARLDPVGADPGQTGSHREWRCRLLSGVEPRPQVEQQLMVEAGANLAGKDEVAAVVLTNQQRTEADP